MWMSDYEYGFTRKKKTIIVFISMFRNLTDVTEQV
jgi:hypothetical protein